MAVMLAELREAQETLARVEEVRQELFDVSNDDGWTTQARAIYRDASRAIYTALPYKSATHGND